MRVPPPGKFPLPPSKIIPPSNPSCPPPLRGVHVGVGRFFEGCPDPAQCPGRRKAFIGDFCTCPRGKCQSSAAPGGLSLNPPPLGSSAMGATRKSRFARNSFLGNNGHSQKTFLSKQFFNVFVLQLTTSPLMVFGTRLQKEGRITYLQHPRTSPY